MKRRVSATLAGLATGILVTSLAAGQAQAKPSGPAPATPDREAAQALREDNLPSPLGEKSEALKKEAISKVISGQLTPVTINGSEVVRLSGNRWVELKKKPAKKDPIFTVLVEFGDQTRADAGGTAGPVHNQIAAPDRVLDGGATDDNTTLWRSDFSRASYQDLLFNPNKESMSDFYLKQSSGRYTVTGDVTDWVKVPFNEARYGSNAVDQTDGYWNFVKDSVQAWYDSRLAAGQTPDQIKSYLSQFDIWDRYDFDADGNFNEPDGYVDHLQVIHAGAGEEAGGGTQGADAIWSHRWYTFSDGQGTSGPSFNLLGGAPVGASGLWVGDYTTEPENGGLGVFCHEYGHDLLLPDLYDTAGGDNGTGFWTIMSAGSWLNHGKQDIGSTPGYMGPWEKLFLGWLDYRSVTYQSGKTVVLGAAGDTTGLLPQAVVVNLPDQVVTTHYNTPFSGSFEWWGGSADNLNTTLTRDIDLTGAASAAVSSKIWYNMEETFDFLYGEVSLDAGRTWTQVGTPLDGDSGGNWVDLNYDLSSFAGKAVKFRFRYQTDGGTHFEGPFLDNITITVGATSTTDDVEAGTNGWTASGFTRFGGTTVESKPHFYIAENRQYVGYDKTLKTGPYQFGWASTQPNLVERFPYQNGLLVWYVNYAYEDNNTISHPGHGLALPVDARPTPIVFPSGNLLGNRRQPFDATFGRTATDPVTFHRNGVAVSVPSQPAIKTFNDTNPNTYYSTGNPLGSVIVAGSGTKIEVTSELQLLNIMVVKVSF